MQRGYVSNGIKILKGPSSSSPRLRIGRIYLLNCVSWRYHCSCFQQLQTGTCYLWQDCPEKKLAMEGHPYQVEDTRRTTTRRCLSMPLRKHHMQAMDRPTHSIPSSLGSPWQPHLDLQTTRPRAIFPPHGSLKRSFPTSTSELRHAPSNSDLLVASIDQRDQYTMTTPLNTCMGLDLPRMPPQISSGRLGAITIVSVPPS